MLDEINLEERAETLNNVLAKIKAGKQSEMTEDEKFSYEVLKKIDEVEKERKAEQETFMNYLKDGHILKNHFDYLFKEVKECDKAVSQLLFSKRFLDSIVSQKVRELGLKGSRYDLDKSICEELLKDEKIQRQLKNVFEKSRTAQEKLNKLARWSEDSLIVDLNEFKDI